MIFELEYSIDIATIRKIATTPQIKCTHGTKNATCTFCISHAPEQEHHKEGQRHPVQHRLEAIKQAFKPDHLGKALG